MSNSVLSFHNKFIIFFSIMALFFGLGVNQVLYPYVLYGVIISLFFAILLSLSVFFVRVKLYHFVFLIMVASFIVKCISVLFFESLMMNIIGIPFLSYKDDYVYNELSSSILRAWESRGFGFYDDVRFSSGFYSGYPNFSAMAKYLFGDHYLVPRFL